jgi:glycosyltransferase involved in cell wall biosynthesis
MTPTSWPSVRSLGSKLRESAPGIYGVMAPAARGIERTVALVQQSHEAYTLRAALTSGRVVPPRAESAPSVLMDGCAFQDGLGGISRLWRAVLTEWSESGFARHVVVLDRGGSAPKHPGFGYLAAPPLRALDSTATPKLLDAVCAAVGADVFVSTGYTSQEACPSLLYLYDMTPEALHWDLESPMWRDKHRAIAKASGFACLSENTAADLHRLYPQTIERICRMALPGVDASFQPASPAEIRDFRTAYDLPEEYFIFLGHRDHYKNADLVFDALSQMDEAPRPGLMLVGGRPELEPGFVEKARRTMVRIASLSDDELRTAYSGAAALLYVSRYEGFGLPILEAMACGCPVITCRNSSLPEAAGDAAIYVGEDDPPALCEAMRRVREPAVRDDLVARGLEHCRRFTWSRTAAEVETAIRRVSL